MVIKANFIAQHRLIPYVGKSAHRLPEAMRQAKPGRPAR
jgi:hypothetical protein